MVGLGITNQRETTVVWDRHTGQPVHNAIVWQDTRTADLLPRIAADLDPQEIRARCGLPLVSYFSGPKLRCDRAQRDVADNRVRLGCRNAGFYQRRDKEVPRHLRAAALPEGMLVRVTGSPTCWRRGASEPGRR